MRHQTAESRRAHPPLHRLLPPSPRTARAQMLLRLIAGFTVILMLLGLDAVVGFVGANSVRSRLESLTQQQTLNNALIDHLRHVQDMVRSAQYPIGSKSAEAEHAEVNRAFTEADDTLNQLILNVNPADLDIQLWHGLKSASSALSTDLGPAFSRSLGRKSPGEISREEESLALATYKLIDSLQARTEAKRKLAEEAIWRQSIEDRVVLAACLLVSILFLVTGTRIHYRMSEQSEELNRVSWEMLDKQEMLAQRISHDLHDELGQSLTALKTNLTRHAAAGCVDPAWMRDCTDLLKGSIRSAHEISQLLHPTLLDDFGLDCALSWLCEKFEERNGIRVRYESDFHWRLEEQAETHIFRIAQEALTNIARHAEATSVDVVFSKQCGIVRLKISDNGVGFRSPRSTCGSCLGLIGMKARARSLEGEMRIDSSPGNGVAIEIVFPDKHAT